MAQHMLLADSLSYGRRLVEAGVHGIRCESDPHPSGAVHHIGEKAEANLKTAVVAGSIALMALILTRRKQRPLTRLLACGTVALFADAIWKSRNSGSERIGRAAQEIGKVRDQHWLELHPIDYA